MVTTTGMPKVAVAPDRASLRPGENVGVDVTIQNASQVVEHYNVSIVGLPRDDLYGCEPSVVKLRPGESGSIQVSISIPDKPAPDAGLYTLGVLVRSPYQRQISRCEELRLEVQPAPALTIEAQPDVSTGGPDAVYTLRVANEGNTVVAVTLTGSDQERKVGFAFRPRSVQIAPNASAPATLTARARAPWTGQEARRMLTLRATATPDLAAERTVTFVQKPRIPGGPMRVVGVAAAVAVLATATIAGALVSKARQEATNKANQAANNTTQQAQQPGIPPVVPGVSTAPAGKASAAPAGGGSGKPPAGGAGGGAKPGVADFTAPPDGQPAGDRIIPGDLYAANGVKLSSNVELAPPGCKNATAVALRTVAGVGAFLTSSSPANAAFCNTLPVKFTLSGPARSVRLVYVPNGTAYRMRVELLDGSLIDVTNTVPAGALATMPFDAPPNNPVVGLQFSHASLDPADKNPTVIKRVAFTPAS
jgi:hypothetical protein